MKFVPVNKILPRLESMVRGEEFAPERSHERFRLALTDHASITLIPPLIRKIRIEAPDVRLEMSQWQERAYEAVIAGRLDAALSAEQAPSGLQPDPSVPRQVDFKDNRSETNPRVKVWQ